jgi:hypothetical protein
VVSVHGRVAVGDVAGFILASIGVKIDRGECVCVYVCVCVCVLWKTVFC